MTSDDGGPTALGSGDGGSSGNSGTSSKGGSGASSSAGKGSGGTSATSPGGTGGTSQGGNDAEAGEDAGGGTRGGKAGTGGTTGSGGSGGGGTSAYGGSGAMGGGAATGTGGGTAGAGATPNHTNPLSKSLIDAFVKAHNDARASNLVPPPSTPLPPVSWDAVLADTAYNYLSKCQSTDGSLVDHNANRTKDYAALGGSDYVGENIFASSASSIDPSDAVSSWMSEASNYKPGDVSSAGHYTQVVWRDSVRIGCAIVNCPSVRLHNTVLCNYAPGGNITGQTPY